MSLSLWYLRLRFLGRWLAQWIPLTIVLFLDYLGGLFIAHHWVLSFAVPLFLLMMELVAFLGMWFQITLAFDIQAAGHSRFHRILYRLSGLIVPFAVVVWLVIYTMAPKG